MKKHISEFFVNVRQFIKSDDAPTMAEYALLLILIALVVAAAATLVGVTINDVLFQPASNIFPSSS